MYRQCTLFGQWPRAGDWFDQDDVEMALMATAARSEHVYGKVAGEQKLTPEDAEFMSWVESDG